MSGESDAAPTPAPAPEAKAAPPSGNASELAILLVEAGLAAAFFGAVLFVAGWSYADRFFAELGLNLSAVDGMASESLYGYALWVFRDSWLTFAALALMLSLIAIITLRPQVQLSLGNGQLALGLAFLAILVLLVAGMLGANRAANQFPAIFENPRESFVRLRVVAKEKTALATFLQKRGDLGNTTCLRKIFMDQRNLYAYAGYESSAGRVPNIYILPLDAIAVVEVIRNPGLCRP